MAKRPTNAQLTALLAERDAQLAQYATSAAVAEVVAPPLSASDKLKAHVEANGQAFARGGRTHLTLAMLQAATTVLQTGEPTTLSLDGVGNYAKRGVTGMAFGVGDDGKSVITQFTYTPTA